MIAAGKHGVGVLSLGAGLPGGPQKLAEQWQHRRGRGARSTAQTMDRKDWRLVVNMHCAEDDERALREVQGRRAARDA